MIIDDDIEIRRFRLREPVDSVGRPMVNGAVEKPGDDVRWTIYAYSDASHQMPVRILDGGTSFEEAVAVARRAAASLKDEISARRFTEGR